MLSRIELNMRNTINIWDVVSFLFSGVGVTVLGYYIKHYFDKKKISQTINGLEENNSIEQEKEYFIYKIENKDLDNRVKLLTYDDWFNKEHPVGSDIGIWIGAYLFGIFLVIPLIFVIITHFYFWKKWHNEYYLYAIEESLRKGDFITASKYAFLLTKVGISIHYYATVIYNVISLCRQKGDNVRAQKLLCKIRNA